VDQGDGTLNTSVGNVPLATYSRNGNLQIAQLYGGAAESSTLAAQGTGALFYGNGLDVGSSGSNSQVLSNGHLQGVGPIVNLSNGTGAPLEGEFQGEGTGIGTDQQGQGIVYRYIWPGFSGSSTNFFQVSVNGGSFIVETNGLIQATNDPQWPVN